MDYSKAGKERKKRAGRRLPQRVAALRLRLRTQSFVFSLPVHVGARSHAVLEHLLMDAEVRVRVDIVLSRKKRNSESSEAWSGR